MGDTLGAAVEFTSPGDFVPVIGYRAGGPHGHAPGEWTDDTSMALALADSDAAGWDLNDQARRYVEWRRQGMYSVNGRCFDIGTTTRAAAARFERHGDARNFADRSERASGNGSILRLAAVPIRHGRLLHSQEERLAALLSESGRATHGSPQCLSACAYPGFMLASLMQGAPREAVLARDWPPLVQLRQLAPLHSQVEAVTAGSFRTRQPPDIRGSGYVVHGLEAALWGCHDAADCRQAVLRLANLGDDADMTGAVCGQLTGAYFGEQSIPAKWLQGLARREMIEAALQKLLA